MVKKILLIVLVLVVVAVAAVGIFIATFDANKYKPVIVKTLQEKLGSRVELGNISLGWRGGIALAFENLAVYANDNTQGPPDLSLDKGFALLKIGPLLRKEIQVAAISLEGPRVHVIRDARGVVGVRGVNIAPGAKGSNTAAAASFLIDSISIADGEVRYEDKALVPAVDVTIKKWGLTMNDVSLVKPISFDSRMALFSDTQNIAIQGKISGLAQNAPSISGLKADIDLGKINVAELMRAVPSLAAAGIGEGLAGNISLSADTIAVANGKLTGLLAEVRLKDGRVPLAALKAPIENVQMDAAAREKHITLKSFSAMMAQASVKGSGSVENFMTDPVVALNASTEIPKLNDFLTVMTGVAPKLDGAVTLSIDGTGRGLDWPTLSKTLSGTGEVTLDKGVLMDTNIARQVIEKLSMFPGLGQTIEQNIPVSIKEKLAQDYTLIQPVKKAFTIQDGNIVLNGLKVVTDLLDINTDTTVTLAGMISGKGVLSFQKDLSGAMLAGFPQMKYLVNADNMVEFPVTYSVGADKVSVLPDLEYIAKKVIAEKGQEILSDIFKKASGETAQPEGQQPAATQPAGTQPAGAAPEQTTEDKIGDFLKGLTGQDEPAPPAQ